MRRGARRPTRKDDKGHEQVGEEGREKASEEGHGSHEQTGEEGRSGGRTLATVTQPSPPLRLSWHDGLTVDHI